MKTRLLLFAVITISLTACSVGRVAEAQVYASVHTRIPVAPNVVLTIETPIIASPGPNHIWVDGYWSWDERYGEYIWVQGYWTLAPYTGAYWIPGYWEYYRGGYRWIDACWLPRDYRFTYGYYSGRYDYYGRPVYYHQPTREIHSGYSYSYDHRPEYRGRGYSSSPSFNEAPKSERNRITKEYQRSSSNNNSGRSSSDSRSSSSTTTTNSRSATTTKPSTTRTNQESIRIRPESESQRRSESTSSGRGASDRTDSSKPEATTPNTTNSRQRTSEGNGSSTRSSSSSGSSTTPARSSSDSRAKSNDSNSNSNARQSGGTTRSSSGSSGRTR